ncbi:M23 family metallopeptidase [Sporosarcina sp. NPDC096371]|uniref:M23 family metallopeptidase n=1 Tax=Sporosarcina sp. NPDC096371 TaxID=3364530 RepID=UPI00381A39E1
MFARPCIGRLTSPFGWRTHPISKKKSWHQGVDLAQSGNVPIYAAADGTVSRVGVLGTYGNVVMVLHTINGKTYETNYAHLHSYDVNVGQKVKQGRKIGRMGNTGSSTGQHLHFEIHVGRWATGQPNAVDPMKYITTVPALGAIGSDVEELQWLLNKHGY